MGQREVTPFIDANIWLYLANPHSPFHLKVSGFLDGFLKKQREFALSWQIFYEFIRSATDPKMFASPVSWQEAFDFIDPIFKLPDATLLQEGPSHGESLNFVLKRIGYKQGHFIHDCHIAALLYENGVKTIITADQDFRRFPFLEVVDPTQ